MLVNRIGQQFGRLIIIDQCISDRAGRRWLALCDCGNWSTPTSTLLSRGVISCGCYGREVSSLTHRKPDGEAVARNKYNAYRGAAKRRGKEWNLSYDKFLSITSKDCFYCNSPPSNCATYTNYNGEFVYNGIDRVDNSKGYLVGNSVPCCIKCNTAKMDMSMNEFITWIRKVHENIQNFNVGKENK